MKYRNLLGLLCTISCFAGCTLQEAKEYGESCSNISKVILPKGQVCNADALCDGKCDAEALETCREFSEFRIFEIDKCPKGYLCYSDVNGNAAQKHVCMYDAFPEGLPFRCGKSEFVDDCSDCYEACYERDDVKICDDGNARCKGNKVQVCKNNRWTTKDVCSKGCENNDCIGGEKEEILTCTQNEDCKGGQLCKKGLCVNISQDECINNDDCDNDKVCNNGKCENKPQTDPECVNDEDCDNDKVCNNGKCENKPQIEPECVNDEDCNGELQICIVGKCEKMPEFGSECVDDEDCDDERQICMLGNCENKPEIGSECVNDEDCDNGKVCNNGKCESDHCTNGASRCKNNKQYYCSEATWIQVEDCLDGCDGDKCKGVLNPDNSCTKNSDCQSNRVCKNKKCDNYTLICSERGKTCYRNDVVHCTNETISVEYCSENETCLVDTCTPNDQIIKCTNADFCPDGLVCYSGEGCVEPEYPHNCPSQTCGKGYFCKNNKCVKISENIDYIECPSGEQYYIGTDACYQAISTTVNCSGDDECQIYCENNRLSNCDNWGCSFYSDKCYKPQEYVIECTYEIPCQKGYYCIDFKCIKLSAPPQCIPDQIDCFDDGKNCNSSYQCV